MLKYEVLKCIDLHEHLSKKVKGTIFVTITNGVFIVRINAGKGFKYESSVYVANILTDIEKVADLIEFDYRNFVENKLFI